MPLSAVKRPLHDARRAGYGFGDIATLPGLPDEPRAHAILVELANDPGVLAVMRDHRWFVPVLSELYPEGSVGEDPVCVLGLNKGKGAEICLRIRTDNLRGFRYRAVIMKTLWHELAHNELSEHTPAFYDMVSRPSVLFSVLCETSHVLVSAPAPIRQLTRRGHRGQSRRCQTAPPCGTALFPPHWYTPS